MQLPAKFLSDVLPQQGVKIFDAVMPGPKGNRPVAQFDFPNGMQGAEGLIDWALQRQADVYVGIAGYGPQQRPITRGKHAGTMKFARWATNALWHRSLRLDIDVSTDPAKAAHSYPTKADAWQALKAFIRTVQLPAPTLVDSGGGLHVYWLFDRDVSLHDWLPLADRLRLAADHYGLRVDPSTTVDAARILRLPGTYNFKFQVPQLVKVVLDGQPLDPQQYMLMLGVFGPQTSITAQPSLGQVPRAARSQDVDPYTANLHPPYSMQGVLKGCPGLLAKFAAGGRYDSEPLWHATLALVNKSADAPAIQERVARALSQGHPAFTEGDFQAKWAQVQDQDYEPPTCEKFAALGMPECRSCPLRATHKSPVVFGRAQTVQQPQRAVPIPTQPPAPPPAPAPQMAMPVGLQSHAVPPPAPVAAPTTHGCFQVTPGVSTIQIVDGDLTRKLCILNGIPSTVKIEPNPVANLPPVKTVRYIGSYPLVTAERLLDAEGKIAIAALTFNRHTDGYARIEFTHRELSEPRAFAVLLASNGLHLTSGDVKLLQDAFMPEFMSQLQRVRQASVIAGRCGWTPGHDNFVLGTKMYSAKGVEGIRPATAQTEMEAYHQAGSESEWRQAFDLVLAGGVDRQAIIALGLAAPLMAFSGIDGALLNAYSPDSGVGKSTLCDAILSVWGSPDKLRKDFRDTTAATFHLATISGNLPMVIDEFTNVEGKDLSSYVYTITQGRERHRLGADSKLKDNPNRWCLPWIATSNRSVHTKLQEHRKDSVAEAARVFEMRLYPLQVDPAMMGSAKATIEKMKHNYGFLGPRLVQLFMSKPADYWRRIVIDYISKWDQKMAMDTSDRFRSVIAALMEIGTVLGTAMGYAFDRAAVVAEVEKHWRIQAEEFELTRVHPSDFIQHYLTDHISRMAVFGGETGNAQVVVPNGDYAGEIRGIARVGQQLNIQCVRIPMKNLREYVSKQNGDYKAVLEWLTGEQARSGMVSRIGQMTFLAGTPRSFRVTGVQFTPGVMGHASLNVVDNSAPALAAVP